MAFKKFNAKLSDLQSKVDAGGFMQPAPTLGDYIGVAARSLGEGLKARDAIQAQKDKEDRAAAAVEARRVKAKQDAAEAEEKKRKLHVKTAINSIQLGQGYEWAAGRKQEAITLLNQMTDGLTTYGAVNDAVNRFYDDKQFFTKKYIVASNISDTSTATQDDNSGQGASDTGNVNDQTDEVLGTTSASALERVARSIPAPIKVGSNSFDVSSLQENTWQQALGDISGKVQKMELSPAIGENQRTQIFEYAKDQGWMTINGLTIKEILNMPSSQDVRDWLEQTDQNNRLSTEELTQVQAIATTMEAQESKASEKALWYNGTDDSLLKMLTTDAGSAQYSAQINILQKGSSNQKEIAKRLVAMRDIYALTQIKEFTLEDLQAFVGAGSAKLAGLEKLLEKKTTGQVSPVVMETLAELKVIAAANEDKPENLTAVQEALKLYKGQMSYDAAEPAAKIELLEKFTARWKGITNPTEKWWDKPENIASIDDITEARFLLKVPSVVANPEAVAMLNDRIAQLEGVQKDEDAQTQTLLKAENVEDARKDLAGMNTPDQVRNWGILNSEILNSDTQLFDDYGELIAALTTQKNDKIAAEDKDLYQAAVKKWHSENKPLLDAADTNEYMRLLGEFEQKWKSLSTPVKTKDYTKANYQTELINFKNMAENGTPTEKAEAEEWFKTSEPIIRATIVAVENLGKLSKEETMKLEADFLITQLGLDPNSPEDRAKVASLNYIKLTTSRTGVPIARNNVTGDVEVIGGNQDTAPVSRDLIRMAAESDLVNIGDNGMTIIMSGTGKTYTITKAEISEGLSFDTELEAVSPDVLEGLSGSQGLKGVGNKVAFFIQDIFGTKSAFGVNATLPKKAMNFLDKLRLNTALKLSAAQGIRDSVWQKAETLKTLPERNWYKGNQNAQLAFENVLKGLQNDSALLDDIIKRDPITGSISEDDKQNAAYTKANLDGLIPIYEAVVARFKEINSGGGSNDTTTTTEENGVSMSDITTSEQLLKKSE